MARTVFFYLTAGPWTVFCLVLSLVAGLLPWTAGFLHWVGRSLWAPIYLAAAGVRLHRHGHADRLDPNKPYVFVSNHSSYFDAPSAMYALRPRSIHFVAKKELFWIPLFGFYLWRSHSVRVDRGNSAKARATMARAAGRVAEDTSILVYAEGTRSRDGKIAAFKRGAFVLALLSQTPIVPITVVGAFNVLRKNSLRITSGPIAVHIGEPIPTEGMTIDDRAEICDRVRGVILDKAAELKARYKIPD